MKKENKTEISKIPVKIHVSDKISETVKQEKGFFIY